MQAVRSRKEFVFEENIPEISPRQQGYVPVPSAIEEGIRQKSLSGRVEWLGRIGDDREVYLIDGALQAEVLGPRVRDEMFRYWEKLDIDVENKWKWSTAILAAGAISLTTAAIAGVPYLIAACAVLVLGSLVATLYYHYQWNYTSSQMNQWKANPAEQIAIRRSEAYSNGFLSVYQTPSLKRLLLPSEVEYLFQKYFEKKCANLARPHLKTLEQKRAWVQEFLTQSPISADVLRDVYGDVPKKYAGLSRQFEHFATCFGLVKSECDKAHGRIAREASEQIYQIGARREELFAPARKELERNQKALSLVRSKRLQNGEDSAQVEKEYKEALRSHQATYETLTAPIQTYFSERLAEANRILREKHSEINRVEQLAAQPYYELGQKLLSAMIACQKYGTECREQLFDPAELLELPSFPKIRVEFRFN